MRESQFGRKSFPDGQRFLEDPRQSPRYPGRSLFASLEDDRGSCFYLCWVSQKLPTSRKTWTFQSKERN